MADVIRLSTTTFNALRSSFVTSLSASLTSLRSELHCGRNSDKRLHHHHHLSFSVLCNYTPLPPRKRLLSFKVHATIAETEQPKWWEKNAGPNMIDIHSTEEFLNALCEAGDRLVIAEFYATWCASCRALFPKFCKTAEEHPEIVFLKVNFDENKSLCKSLNVKVLPYFHFYRGADGELESFSCSLAKFRRLKDAIQRHNTARGCTLPPLKVEDPSVESLSAQAKKLSGLD